MATDPEAAGYLCSLTQALTVQCQPASRPTPGSIYASPSTSPSTSPAPSPSASPHRPAAADVGTSACTTPASSSSPAPGSPASAASLLVVPKLALLCLGQQEVLSRLQLQQSKDAAELDAIRRTASSATALLLKISHQLAAALGVKAPATLEQVGLASAD